MTWLDLWRYAREDPGRMARLLVLILMALICVAGPVLTVVILL